jgi:molybdopterin synthase sulfur carrier subunit
MINVLFFARLREQLGCEQTQLDAENVLDLMAVRDALVKQHPAWREYLFDHSLLAAVNQMLVKGNPVIHDGDEVAFFPPVTGG